MKQDQVVLNQSLLTDQQTAAQNHSLSKLKADCFNKTIDGESWFQTLYVTWVMPLLNYGAKNAVEVDMMPKLPQNQTTSVQFNRFLQIWSTIQKSERQGFTLIRALFKTFKRQWIILAGIIVMIETFFISSPVLTALNIDYLTNHQEQINYGILLFLLTFFHGVIHRTFFSQYFYRFIGLGIKLSNLVTMIVYNKALKYKPLADKQFSEAQIINYSQVDAQRLTGVGENVAALFYGPLQIICGLIMLYLLLKLAILASVGILFLVLIASYFLSKITVRLNELLLKAKDQRMKVTEEMLQIIRFIKITAIQKFFFKKVNDKRTFQVGVMIKRGLNFVFIVGLFYFTCPMLIAGSYLVYILIGYEINAQVAFTTMTVVSLFQYPMYSLPTAISEILQIVTSLKRIQKFLYAQEIDVKHIQYSSKDSAFAVQIGSGNFYWKREKKEEKEEDKKKENEQDKQKGQKTQSQSKINDIVSDQVTETQEQSQIIDSQNEEQDLKKFREKDEKGKSLYIHVLKDINTKIERGSFTMIVGDIGSGKSSLLQAIINEIITASSSRITLSGELAYSPQKPWIMSATLKENITFTLPLIQQKFKKVMHFACLEDDIKMLPNGIDTQIGEKGVNISGGQKARVSLARALYSQRDIYLLDDILSAVDVHVGDFIVKETVRKFLKGKTVIMPSHAIKFAPLADEIIVMKKGRIVRKGNFKDISKTAEFEEVSSKQHQKQEKKAKQKEEQKQENLQTELAMISEVLRKKTKSQNSLDGGQQWTTNEVIQQLILPQDHKQGTIDSKVLKTFIKLTGGYFKFLGVILFTIIGYIASKTISSIVIQIWCQNPSGEDYEVYIFIALNVLSISFIAFMSYTITISGGKQSTIAHRNVIVSLLYASLGNFYNRVPIGRIVNRLTKDLRQLDQAIMASLLYFLINVVQLVGILIICVYTTTPYALIPMLIIGFLGNKVRKYYLKTQRQVCRYQKSTNSPVVSGFMSAISGLSTLRAYKRQFEFTEIQYKLFDKNKRVRITKIALENWFANALGYMSFLINMPCIAYCMFSKSSDPSTMGLLMSYALGLSFNVVGLTLSEADFQTKLTSLQRVYKFMEIQPEKRYIQYCKNWNPDQQGGQQVINKGALEFKQVKVRYRKDLPDVIKRITCKIEPGEKIGIVGRTGAGKTTIINTLLGVTEISNGSIIIDGKSIQQYSLKDLRYSITMIDQEPTLIKSTFRENLDLTGRYTDEQLLQILKQCNLFDIIQEKGGLDGAVSNTSLSAGEKQLLCICRAFLKHSKIVLIDEATANIDVKNDAIIQRVITEKFKQSTVFTIAHRLSTLKNSDKIMVMDQGQLVEFGDPNDLERKAGGMYSEMIKRHDKDMLT